MLTSQIQMSDLYHILAPRDSLHAYTSQPDRAMFCSLSQTQPIVPIQPHRDRDSGTSLYLFVSKARIWRTSCLTPATHLADKQHVRRFETCFHVRRDRGLENAVASALGLTETTTPSLAWLVFFLAQWHGTDHTVLSELHQSDAATGPVQATASDSANPSARFFHFASEIENSVFVQSKALI